MVLIRPCGIQEICHVFSLQINLVQVFVLVGYICICYLNGNRTSISFFKPFGQIDRHFNRCNLSNYTTTDVSAPECLRFLQYTMPVSGAAAWCVYSGNDLLFLSNGLFFNKPKHLLEFTSNHCMCLITVYS